jgi:LuxR family maltose regulon positive regulatory protein
VAGFLNYERGELQTAEAHFNKVIDLRYRANFNGAFNASLCLARIHLINDKISDAQELIDNLREATLRINNSDLLPGLEAAQAELWLYQKNIPAAKRWAQSFQTEITADKVIKFESPMLNQARILLSHGSKAEVQAVRRRLEQELHYLESYNFTYRAIQYLAHLALVYGHLAMEDEALATLQRAITLAQPGGLIRTFLDCGSGLVPLLNRLATATSDKSHILQLLTAFEPGKASASPTVDDSVDLLTRREYEVLQLLADGGTNQESADKLFISLNTIKRHNANIYRKLAVNNRREALRKARLLNYIL